jgi:SagB-type dehydrogenase family enzyme
MNAPTDAMPGDIRAYHQRTKHAPNRYALGPAFLDWTSQPNPFRRYLGAKTIELPLSGAAAPAFPGPAPTPAALTLETLGLFFELSFGLSAWKSVEGSTWALRNNPSSGNLHPTESYALLDALPGAGNAAALYHYAPEPHALEERAIYDAPRILPEGGFVLALTAIPWREAWKYGERAFRYCQLDGGHAFGAAAQAAAALGWRATLLTAPADDEISALLGLAREDAAHRREGEHPEALMWIATDPSAPTPAFDPKQALEPTRAWRGSANRLSDDHDGWPAVDLALRFCRKPRGDMLAAPAALPQEAVTGTDIGDVVRRRRSAQRMDGQTSLPLAAFAAMLKALAPGAGPMMSCFPYAPRIAPAFFVHRVDGLAPGLYLLARDAETTQRLRAAMSPEFLWRAVDVGGVELILLSEGDVEREATRLSCLQPIAGKGCFGLSMIADFTRTLDEDGEFGYRRLHWEAGLIGQVLYLYATAFGVAGTGIGCFFDDELHALVGLPQGVHAFQTVYHFTIGGAVEDARLLTLPPYPPERRAQR